MANVVEYRIKGVDKASPAFKSVGKSVAGIAKTVARAGAVMGTAFIAAGGAALTLTHKVAGAQDRVQKMSDRLGIAVDKLSEFHHAAELGGVRAETFNMALQRMARRVAEAGQGMGEAQDALRELGIDAASISKLPLDQQMNVVADSLSGVETQSEKVRLAFKLFDSEGVAMLQTMKDGSQSFRDAAADLERLGGVMSKQGTANAAKFKDEWTRLKTALGGVSLGIGNELIPLFTGLFQKITDWIANARPRIVAFVSGLIENFFTFGAIVGQVFDKVSTTMSNLFSLDTMAETLNGIVQGFIDTGTAIVEVMMDVGPHLARILIGSFRAAWSAFRNLAEGALDHVFDFITGNDIAKPFGEIVADAVRAAQSELAPFETDVNKTIQIITGAASSASDSIKSIFGINTEAAQAQAKSAIEGLIKFGQIADETLQNSVGKIDTMMSVFNEKRDMFVMTNKEIFTGFLEGLKATMDGAISAIGTGIGDIIVDGKNAAEVFKSIAKGILKQLIATYITMKLQRVLFAKTELTAGIASTGVNTMSSMSAAPFPINLTAPAVAAQHMSLASAMAAQLAGAAHGGLDNVPNESTYLLQRGERVLSPNQNRDLTEFLSSQGGTSVGDVTVNVFTTASDFGSISPSDVQEFVAGKVIPAMDRLDRQGIRPVAIERALS